MSRDYAEAGRWSEKAADQNYAEAQDALGSMYYAGQGLPQDFSQAFIWYRKAAEHGYARAEFDLATMYYNGIGTTRDYAEGRRWCIRAAMHADGETEHALKLLAMEVGMVTKLELFEFLTALPLGVWVLASFFVHRGNGLDWRQGSLLLLAIVFLAISGMSLYVVVHGGLGYCSYPVAFRIVKRVLIGTACLIIVTVVLPAKKPNAAPAQ